MFTFRAKNLSIINERGRGGCRRRHPSPLVTRRLRQFTVYLCHCDPILWPMYRKKLGRVTETTAKINRCFHAYRNLHFFNCAAIKSKIWDPVAWQPASPSILCPTLLGVVLMLLPEYELDKTTWYCVEAHVWVYIMCLWDLDHWRFFSSKIGLWDRNLPPSIELLHFLCSYAMWPCDLNLWHKGISYRSSNWHLSTRPRSNWPWNFACWVVSQIFIYFKFYDDRMRGIGAISLSTYLTLIMYKKNYFLLY